MIVGLGLDIEEIGRIAGLVERWGDRFTHRIYTPAERDFCCARSHQARHYAARFAAKEALLKALGVPKGLSWQELEIRGGGDQPPGMFLTGRARLAAEQRGVTSLHLSLTHTTETAAAVVIAESAPDRTGARILAEE